MTNYVIPAAPQVSVPVLGTDARFPVQRIYCVGRNYVEHAQEMGFTGREPPFFFIKPANTVVVVDAGVTATVPYPPLTKDYQHEIELVVCIGKGGKNIAVADAKDHIYGYAVGFDMTRRDLQTEQKKLGRPWCIGKSFDHASPIGPITPAAQVGDLDDADIYVQVAGKDRQRSTISKLIWNVSEVIAHISNAWELQAGDLIYTGTPAGVAAVAVGDTMHGHVDGLTDIAVKVVA